MSPRTRKSGLLATVLPKGRAFVRALADDTDGNVMALGAVGLLVSAALVGGSVEMSRAYKVQARLQSACDAGVLAGRKAVTVNGFNSEAEDEARSYFNNNFDEDGQGARSTAFTVSSPDNGNTIEGTATSTLDSTVMQVFGFDTIDVATDCSASMGVGNSDVTMVLDTTGSMGSRLSGSSDTKLEMLQDAMKSFYDTLAAATAAGNTRVRYAFVPYSSAVNVGNLIYDLDPDYLVDSYAIQSREPTFVTTTVQVFDHWDSPVTTTGSGVGSERSTGEGYYGSSSYTSSGSCSTSLPSDTAWSNTGSPVTGTTTTVNAQGQQVTTTTTTRQQTRRVYSCATVTSGRGRRRTTSYRPYYTDYARDLDSYTYETRDPVYYTTETNEFDHFVYKQVTYDVSAFKTGASVATPTGNNGADQTSSWDGCIEERRTTPAASFHFNGTKITPVSAKDLDIDLEPDAGDDDTRWAPMWPDVAYYRTTSNGRSITNATTSLYGLQPSSYCPRGAQLLSEMSESEFDAYADSLQARGSTYHDLGILWGGRISSPTGIFAANVNEDPANGGNVARHLIFMTDGQMSTSTTIQSTYGIEYHDRRVTANGSSATSRHTERFLALCEAVKAKGIRLWVIAFSTGLTTNLSTCASDNSAFTANNADELNASFQEIANQVGELRITQ